MYSDEICNMWEDWAQPSVGCYEFPQQTDGFYISSWYSGGSCAAESEEVIPELSWDAVVRGCSGPIPPQECNANGDRCYDVPADGYESEICFIAEGDIPCPPGTDYSEKTIRYTSVTDSRDCTTCQCGSVGGGFEGECIENYDFFTSNDCSGSAAGTANGFGCNASPGAQSVSIEFDPKGCPVQSEPEPEGEAAPEQPWTYCCAPF